MMLRRRNSVAAVLRQLATLLVLAQPRTAGARGTYDLAPPNAPVTLSADTELLKKVEAAMRGLAAYADQALVLVATSVEQEPTTYPFGFPPELFGLPPDSRDGPKVSGKGSGFIVDLTAGYIITNHHVIKGAQEISIKFSNDNDRTYTAHVVGADPGTDIAVLQVEDKFERHGLTQLVLGDSDQVRRGDLVLALGAPQGLERSVTSGIISATSRGNLSVTRAGDFLQTDAAINPGNSGGPLIDTDGRVVGMNTLIYSGSGGSIGLGFAVPSNIVRSVSTNLINGKPIGGFLGIQFSPLVDHDVKKFHGIDEDTNAVVIVKVVASSPAEKAGLRPRDVILALDGKSFKNDSEFRNWISLSTPGDQRTLKILRDNKIISVKVTIGTSGETDVIYGTPQTEDGVSDNNLGLDLEVRSNQLFVKGVDRRSAAARFLREGDRLVQVGSRDLARVKRLSDAIAAIRQEVKAARQQKEGRASVIVAIERDNEYIFHRIPIAAGKGRR